MFRYRAVIALLSIVVTTVLPHPGNAHGSPQRWSAESTEMGCWISRWLGRIPESGGEEMVGLQVVIGRIVPPRGDIDQPAITKAELEGASTINIRVVDPTLKDAETVTVVRTKHTPIDLRKRPAQEGMGDFPSFYLTGAPVDSILESLRKGEVSEFIVRVGNGKDAVYTNSKAGLRVGLAMYDACIASKPL